MKVNPEKAFSNHLEYHRDWGSLMHGFDKACVLKIINPNEYQEKLEEYQSERLCRCTVCGDWFDFKGDLDNGICWDCQQDIEEEEKEKAEVEVRPSQETVPNQPQDGS